MYAVHVRYVTYYELSFSKAATAVYPTVKSARDGHNVSFKYPVKRLT